jgi:hypothetical protein
LDDVFLIVHRATAFLRLSSLQYEPMHLFGQSWKTILPGGILTLMCLIIIPSRRCQYVCMVSFHVCERFHAPVSATIFSSTLEILQP